MAIARVEEAYLSRKESSLAQGTAELLKDGAGGGSMTFLWYNMPRGQNVKQIDTF